MHPIVHRVSLLALTLLVAACGSVPELVGSVGGRVVTADGSPLAGASVTAVTDDGVVPTSLASSSLRTQAIDATRTDAGGWFDLELPPGDYLLTVASESEGVMRHVRVGDEPTRLDLRAGRLGHVRGTVRLGDQTAHAGIAVFAHGTTRTSETVAGGEFLLTDLPAGSYRLAAADASYVGGPVDVTVEPATTVAAPPITITARDAVAEDPPELASVTPSFLVWSEVDAMLSGAATTVTLRGSGFGERRGLGRLLYGGYDVQDAVIASWSDDEITVSFHAPGELLGIVSSDYRLTSASKVGPSVYVPPELQRFEIRTLSGEATSEPVRIVAPRLELGWASGPDQDVYVETRIVDAFGLPVAGVALSLSANRGTLADTAMTTDAGGFASTTLTTVDALPHAVTASHAGGPVAQDVTLRLQATPSYHRVEPETDTLVAMTLTTYDGAAMAGAPLDLVLVSEAGPRHGWHALGRHETGASGELEVPLPPLPAGLVHTLLVVQDGNLVTTAHVYPEVSGPR